MNTEKKVLHSQLPFEQDGDNGRLFIYDKTGNLVATITNRVKIAGIDDAVTGSISHETVANSGFIVRACNSHYEVLEALENLLYWYNEVSAGNVTKNYEAEEQAQSAITKAKGI